MVSSFNKFGSIDEILKRCIPSTLSNSFTNSKKVRAKRSKMLRGLSVKKRRAFYESQIGNSSTVLFESENKEGYIHGFTENYVKVKTPWNPDLVNTLQQILLTKIDEDGLVRFDFINELISSSAT